MTIKYTQATDEQRLFELYKIALGKEDNPTFAMRWAVRRLTYFERECQSPTYRKEMENADGNND